MEMEPWLVPGGSVGVWCWDPSAGDQPARSECVTGARRLGHGTVLVPAWLGHSVVPVLGGASAGRLGQSVVLERGGLVGARCWCQRSWLSAVPAPDGSAGARCRCWAVPVPRGWSSTVPVPGCGVGEQCRCLAGSWCWCWTAWPDHGADVQLDCGAGAGWHGQITVPMSVQITVPVPDGMAGSRCRCLARMWCRCWTAWPDRSANVQPDCDAGARWHGRIPVPMPGDVAGLWCRCLGGSWCRCWVAWPHHGADVHLDNGTGARRRGRIMMPLSIRIVVPVPVGVARSRC